MDKEKSNDITKDKVLSFVRELIESYKYEVSDKIYERSWNSEKEIAELEKECEKWEKEFIKLLEVK